MHGLIHFSLRRFVEQEVPDLQWNIIMSHIGLEDREYSLTKDFPDWELLATIEEIRIFLESKGQSGHDIQIRFGKFLAKELIGLNSVSLDPNWTFFDVLLNVEHAIHDVIRMANPNADPPVLKVQSQGEGQVQILYGSRRKLCRLAHGLLLGIAEKFKTEITIREESCMLEGAPFCTLTVQLSPNTTPRREGRKILKVEEQIDASAKEFTKTSIMRDSQFSFLPQPENQEELASLGTYSLVEFLGKGSMGQVYRAIDRRLEREVAVKVLAPHLLGEPTARERFLLEAKNMASLTHPCIIPVLQVEEYEGLPFIVMPLLKGMTLFEWISCGSSGMTAYNANFALCVAYGLQAAHQREIIHRDIKPENIWISAKNAPLIMDFGLSIRISDDSRLTRSGLLVGTPMYMAPEQAEARDIDYRTDIYSLGATLYHLFTGQSPFSEPTISTLLIALAQKSPIPPREINSEISPHLEDLLLQMMEKHPNERPSMVSILDCFIRMKDELKQISAHSEYQIEEDQINQYQS
jgi:hypothetical protein